MKWFIASDIHGSAVYCEKMIEAYKREEADRMILLGDILYHGPRNDLPEGYAPKKVIAMLEPFADQIFSVRGNCEAEVDQMVLSFPALSDYALLPFGKNLIYITHGHHYNTRNLPPMKKGDILLHGHTHIPAWEKTENYIYFNPGSVSIPKNNTPHSYMTYENDTFLWKDINGIVYHEEIVK